MNDSTAQHQSDQSPQGESIDLTGRTLGNYLLIRRLGRGGMADVYLAQQTTLDRPVALKILKPDLARDETYVERFKREAQAAAALSQANIVQIYEVGEIEGYQTIAQEYVRGQNLKQFLNRHNVAEPILAVSILRQVATALKTASENGVIHRDIKPENILLSPNGEVKVADFGLARVLDDKRTDLTQVGITMGTPLYMSPEQAEGGKVDSRSDMYSLGVTAYHMLAGQPPFEGENALAIAVKHLKEEASDLAQVRPDIPPELCKLVMQMMAKKPDDRLQTPAQLLKELRTLEMDESADWDSLTEKLSESETTFLGVSQTVPQTTLEVTKQLEAVMTGQFRKWWQAPGLWIAMVVMAVMGLIVGTVYAVMNPLPDPLEVQLQLSKSQVPRMATVRDQFFYAFNRHEEDLYLVVERYFPPFAPDEEARGINFMYALKADEQLAYLYLDTEDWHKALNKFSYLAYGLSETEWHFKNVGLAGLAVVYDNLPDPNLDDETREQRIHEFLTEVDETELNEFLREKVELLFVKYSQHRPH